MLISFALSVALWSPSSLWGSVLCTSGMYHPAPSGWQPAQMPCSVCLSQLQVQGSLVQMGCQPQERGNWLRELEVYKFCVPAQSTLCTTPSHRVHFSDYIVELTIPEPPPAENKGILTLQMWPDSQSWWWPVLDAYGKSTSEMSKSPSAGFPLSNVLVYLGCLFGGVTQIFVPKVMVVVVSLAHWKSLLLSHC